MPIARDFITVDFEGSKENASVAHFVLDDISDLQISFEKNHQRWIVETPMERAVYGQYDKAIQWTLAWPYWRGSGKDTNNLKRETSERRSKFTGEALFYHYDLDTESVLGSGPSYTSAMRLKEIKDAKEFSIKFQYQRKDDHEF